MNESRDLDRLLDAWFAEGPVQVADRVIDDTANRIARQRQTPAWRLRSWRFPTMSTPIKLVAIGAALLAVLVGGAVFMGGGAGPAPVPAPSATATPAPTPSPSVGLVPDGALEAGDYRLSFPDSTTTAIVTVPDGWWGFATGAVAAPNADPELLILSVAPSGLYPDPCQWKTGAAPVTVGPTVDDLVSAIVASPHMEAGEPTAITMDGHSGTQIQVRMPSDIDFDACEEGYWYPFATDAQVIRPQGPGNIWNMRLLDVAGERLVVMEEYFDGTPAAAKTASQAVLDTLRLDVP